MKCKCVLVEEALQDMRLFLPQVKEDTNIIIKKTKHKIILRYIKTNNISLLHQKEPLSKLLTLQHMNLLLRKVSNNWSIKPISLHLKRCIYLHLKNRQLKLDKPETYLYISLKDSS